REVPLLRGFHDAVEQDEQLRDDPAHRFAPKKSATTGARAAASTLCGWPSRVPAISPKSSMPNASPGPRLLIFPLCTRNASLLEPPPMSPLRLTALAWLEVPPSR